MSVVFKDGSLYRQSKVDMINECLIAIGEVPLSYEVQDVLNDFPLGSDVDIARRTVEKTMIDVQSMGWWFNIDYNYKLTPDENGFIPVPLNALRVDFGESNTPHRYTVRRGRIYDLADQTYIIKEEIYPDIMWLRDYEDLPSVAYNYIASKAAKNFQKSIIGSMETDSLLSRQEIEYLTDLQRRQAQEMDYKMSNPLVSTRMTNAYLKQGLYNVVTRRRF
jgi:hypothetical protein